MNGPWTKTNRAFFFGSSMLGHLGSTRSPPAKIVHVFTNDLQLVWREHRYVPHDVMWGDVTRRVDLIRVHLEDTGDRLHGFLVRDRFCSILHAIQKGTRLAGVDRQLPHA